MLAPIVPVCKRIVKLGKKNSRAFPFSLQAAYGGFSFEREEHRGDAVAPMLLTLKHWRGAQRREDCFFERTEKT
jgi:hypothetical protein